MDERPTQFTLRILLIEVTLIALALGLVRVVFHRWDDPTDPRFIFNVAALFALPPLCGAIIGGIAGRFAEGVVWGSVAIGGMILILGCLFPAIQ